MIHNIPKKDEATQANIEQKQTQKVKHHQKILKEKRMGIFTEGGCQCAFVINTGHHDYIKFANPAAQMI